MKTVSLEDEHAALTDEAIKLQTLVFQEWQTMSWQIACERRDRLDWIDNRIAAINRSIARRKRKAK